MNIFGPAGASRNGPTRGHQQQYNLQHHAHCTKTHTGLTVPRVTQPGVTT
jgi:hypothetical protein